MDPENVGQSGSNRRSITKLRDTVKLMAQHAGTMKVTLIILAASIVVAAGGWCVFGGQLVRGKTIFVTQYDTVVVLVEKAGLDLEVPSHRDFRHLMAQMDAVQNLLLILNTRMNPNPISESAPPKTNHAIEVSTIEAKNAHIAHPRFKLPGHVVGCIPNKLTSYARIADLAPEYNANRDISFEIELLDPTLSEKISPVIVNALRKESSNSYQKLSSQQFRLEPGKNIITIPADFGIGNFTIEVGFYFLDETDEEYPPYYRKQINVAVK
jgi:hypothetical protein